uniref:Ovule protein n=1 Tax=Mesocestoides corti TaxID=53468 RepID=A0A5K3FSA3_MESCO
MEEKVFGLLSHNPTPPTYLLALPSTPTLLSLETVESHSQPPTNTLHPCMAVCPCHHFLTLDDIRQRFELFLCSNPSPPRTAHAVAISAPQSAPANTLTFTLLFPGSFTNCQVTSIHASFHISSSIHRHLTRKME